MVDHSGTILVVDDEPGSLALLTSILKDAGYEVRPADSGELALESVRAKAPELILLDIRMPGMGGYEACRRLKARQESRGIPLIFISAANEFEERLEGLRLGAVDFVSKPFRSEELLARVHTHLELGRLRTQLEKRVAERTAELRVANEQLKRELDEREIIEQALRESEGRFRDLADTAPVIIWVSGPDGAMTFFNQQASIFAGQTLEGLLGSGWEGSAHPDDLRGLYRKFYAAVEGRCPFRLEARFRRADGEYRWMLNTGTPRFVGRVYVGHVGTMSDITDLKRHHEQMLATQKLQSLGVLASGIAHDFNNLLGSICAEVDLALSLIPSDSSGRESLDRICTAAVRGSEISNLLMDFAGGKGDNSGFALVNLSTLIEETIKVLKASLATKAALEIDLDPNLPEIRVNAAQIRRVVMNLITNASEALEGQEGFIRITSALAHVHQGSGPSGGVSLSDGEYVLLTISDTGCGIAEQAQANVFDPFYSTKALGRGLGLSAVQGILRAHGGGINLMSAPRKGSTFQVFLPCDASVSEKPLQTAEGGEQQSTSMDQVLLLVEDENTLRLAVSKSLQRNGFVVMDAEDGQAAVDLFRAHAKDIDLVLLDLTLPDMSGPEVSREIRRIRQDVKVFFTSAYDPEILGAGSAFSKEPLSNFIRKPYRIKELVCTLREALATPKSHSATSNG